MNNLTFNIITFNQQKEKQLLTSPSYVYQKGDNIFSHSVYS